jgi:hypothetical protein
MRSAELSERPGGLALSTDSISALAVLACSTAIWRNQNHISGSTEMHVSRL